VEKAVGAAQALPPLERCSDLAILRGAVKLPDDPAVQARVQQLRRRLAEVKVLGDAGRMSAALAGAQSLAADARQLGYLPVTAEALVRLGWVSSGRPVEAEAIFDEAIWAAEASGDNELLAEAAVAQVLTAGFLNGHPEKARLWIRLADATLNRIGGHDVLRSWLLNNEGAVFYAQARYDESLLMFRKSAALKEKLLGADDADTALSVANMSAPLAKLGRFEEAEAASERAVSILERIRIDHPSLPAALSSQGEYLMALGRFAEAEAVENRSIRLSEGKLDKDDVFFGYPWTVLGHLYLAQDRPREAVPYLERAYALRQRVDPEPSRLGETAFALALALWRSSRHARPRALALAIDAERAYAKTPEAKPLATIRAWLEGQHHLTWEP
jgi:eukaryotic-like serine/threonine-protein kinase